MAQLNYGGDIDNVSISRRAINQDKKARIKLEKEIQELIKKGRLAEAAELKKTYEEIIDRELVATVTRQKMISNAIKADEEYKTKADNERIANNAVATKNAGKSLAAYAAKAAYAAAGSLKDQLDTTMSEYLEKQQAIAYNLNGTSNNFQSLSNSLIKGYSGNPYVKQSQIYEKLSDLVSAGLAYTDVNSAYVQSLAESLGMVFNATSGTLPRLFALQKTDLSYHRAAIEASLKTFLNQNYQTSVYIKEGFQEVSDALIEAQSMMSSYNAVTTEATVQKWLGSWSSSGLSTSATTALAQAIGLLGSGDVSELSSNSINNLIMLGAQRAGLSYSDLLLNGIDSNSTNRLFQGMITYINDFSSNRNNVVYSEIADLFGMTVSDLKAAANLMNTSSNLFYQTISYDINTSLLGKLNSYTTQATRLNNVLDNVMYSWAAGVAGDEAKYMSYRVTNAAMSIADALVGAIGWDLGVSIDTSELLQTTVPLLSVIPQLASSLSSAMINLGWADEDGWLARISSMLGKAENKVDLLKNLFSKKGNSQSSGSIYDGNTGQWVSVPGLSSSIISVDSETVQTGDEILNASANDTASLSVHLGGTSENAVTVNGTNIDQIEKAQTETANNTYNMNATLDKIYEQLSTSKLFNTLNSTNNLATAGYGGVGIS